MQMNLSTVFPAAIYSSNEVIATQRRCHKKLKPVS